MSGLSDDLWDDPPARSADTSARTGPIEPGTRPVGHRFVTDADACELDDRGRLAGSWVVRTSELSRSSIVLYSRRLAYPGRMLAVALHLVNAEPTVLLGRVITCEYEESGLHRIDLDLIPPPEPAVLRRWANSLMPRKKRA